MDTTRPTRPRTDATGGVPTQPAKLPGIDIEVAAFGDSLMWGQGLNRNDRFSMLFTKALARHTGKSTRLLYDRSRSGAKISATGKDRPDFVDIYPGLFTRAAKARFLDGIEDPSVKLYGEVPATFPTVRGQLKMLDQALADTVGVALVDGGVNDIAIEKIVDPRVATGAFVEEFDSTITQFGYDDVFDLLQRTRNKCPNAVILYFGFFPALSYESDLSKLYDFFKHEFNDDFLWWLNENVFHKTDVNSVLREARVRTVWFAGRWQYWTQKAVDDANHHPAIRGPGVIYVPSGFRSDNAVFAPNPWLWDDPYDPTADAARPARVAKIPRIAQLATMEKMLRDLRMPNGVVSKARATKLRDAIDGPNDLRATLRSRSRNLPRELDREIGRIHHGMIASTAHPNPAGARSYAANAIDRYQRRETIAARILAEQIRQPTTPAQAETIDQLLTRCKLRSIGPLEDDIGRLDIDSFRLRIITAATSDRNLLPDVWLVVTTNDGTNVVHHQYLVNFQYVRTNLLGNLVVAVKLYPHFEPGTTHLFTNETSDRVRLEHVVGSALVVGDDTAGPGTIGHGTVWKPERVTLEVNGVQVVDIAATGQRLRPGQSLDLHWPAPQPKFTPPKLAPLDMTPIRRPQLVPTAPPPDIVIRAGAPKTTGRAATRRRPVNPAD